MQTEPNEQQIETSPLMAEIRAHLDQFFGAIETPRSAPRTPVAIHDATIEGATLTLILSDGRTATHELAGRL